MPDVLVVIPTVTGREEVLEYVKNGYYNTSPCSIVVLKDRATCGEVWNWGANRARELGYEYVHLGADDLYPHPGWYESAVEVMKTGDLPGALIYNPDGSIDSWGNQPQEEFSELNGGSVPFLKPEKWIDIPNIHYYSDNAYDAAQKIVNECKFVACRGYAFTHHAASPGRKNLGDDEKEIYEQFLRTTKFLAAKIQDNSCASNA